MYKYRNGLMFMRILWVFALFVLTACTTQPATQPIVSDGKTEAYDCGTAEAPQSLVVNFRDDSAWVFSKEATLKLVKAVSASGEKYADSSDNIFWLHQGEALADIHGSQYRNCRKNHRESIWQGAKLRGVDYRAVGQEPPWTLEITNRNQLQVFIGYDRQLHSFTLAEPSSDTSKRTTHYQGDGVQLTITGSECHDSMSGEAFESSVQLIIGDKHYRGCGRALH